MTLLNTSTMPSKWRLVIQRDPESGDCVPYLLERVRVRFFLDGSFIPVWKAPSRNARGAYGAELTVRSGPRHHFRLMTGGEPREQVMSESLNFRGMWPQEIYVYMREFQHAVHRYVEDTFQEQIAHEKRLREFQRAESERKFREREQLRAKRVERDRQIVEMWKSGKTSFGIAVELNMKLHAVKHAIANRDKTEELIVAE